MVMLMESGVIVIGLLLWCREVLVVLIVVMIL